MIPEADRLWDLADIAGAAERCLRAEAERLDAESAARGLDAPAELGLHPVLERGFINAGFGVAREVRYPTGAERRKRSAGDRCDFVLTPSPNEPLEDPAGAFTLFAGEGYPPDRALWIEVKTVRQFALVRGIASRDPGYAARLGGPLMRDLAKLAGDPRLGPAAALVVLFCDQESTALHDLAIWAHRALDRGLRLSPPRRRGFSITDRLGNAWCEILVAGVRRD